MKATEFVEAFETLFKTEKHRVGREWADYRQTGKKPDAFGIDFGLRSAELNRDLRARCAQPSREEYDKMSPEEKTERVRLKWAYAYWWNRLHLLEHLAKSRMGEARTKKNIEKGGMTLRKLISGELTVDKIHPQFLKLIESLNRMKIEQAVVKQADNLLKEEEPPTEDSGDQPTD